MRHVGFGEAYLSPGTTQAWVQSPIHLPENAEVTSLKCLLKDNFSVAPNRIAATLRRYSTRTDDYVMASVSTTDADANPEPQVLVDTTIDYSMIHNADYAYYLNVWLTGTQNTRDLSISWCQVTYTMNRLSF
jgi:hypothetical protein